MTRWIFGASLFLLRWYSSNFWIGNNGGFARPFGATMLIGIRDLCSGGLLARFGRTLSLEIYFGNRPKIPLTRGVQLPTFSVNELFCHRRLGFHWRESRARIGRAWASREGVAADGE